MDGRYDGGDSPSGGTPPGSGTDTGAVPSEPPVTLMDAQTQPLWRIERDLRRARARQVLWMLRFHERTLTSVREGWAAKFQEAQRCGASRERLDNIARTAQLAEQEAGRAAVLHMGQALGRSEYSVEAELSAARRAAKRLPAVWEGFLAGRICVLRLKKIAAASENLRTDEALEKLDEQALEFAQTHRIGQLESWLRRFEHRAEPQEAAERFARAARTRRVTVVDREDGMSMLSALLPTFTAHAIKRRLDSVARSATADIPHNSFIADQIRQLERLEPQRRAEAWRQAAETAEADHPCLPPEALPPEAGEASDESIPASSDETWGPDSVGQQPHVQPAEDQDLPPTSRSEGDPRNLDQRSADAFCAWLLSAQSPEEIQVDAQIGVIVSQETLLGESEEPGRTRDGRMPLPARNLRDMLARQTERLDWYELIMTSTANAQRPSERQNLLAIRAAGRYPPARLRTALWFRDSTCAADGCRVPAEFCDIDHIAPWPEGSTEAENLQPLCRRHHRLKSWSFAVRADLIQAA